MKRIVLLICSLCLLLQLSACAAPEKEYSSSAELYEAGLELVSVMEEMIQSKDYSRLMGASMVEDLAEAVDTGDYDSPVDVYCISMPEVSKLLAIQDDSAAGLWEGLPDDLKRQVEKRFSFSTLVNMINNSQSQETIAFSALYIAADKNEDIRLEEPTVYLYVFEEGTPIAVTFSESGNMTGQFLFLENADSSASVKAAFREFRCSVSKVDID